MDSPRVLINATSFTIGGGRNYFGHLLSELARDDRGLRFVVLALPGQLDDLDTSGVDVELLRLPSVPRRELWRVLYEETLLPFRARRFDVLFCQGDISPFFGSTPTVVLLRNMNIYDQRWYGGARTRTLERLVRWGIPNAARILFPTQAAADQIAARIPIPAERITVIHYGVDIEDWESDRRERSQPVAATEPNPPQRPYLFLPAAPERHKNIGLVIEALPHLRERSIELWIAGRSLIDPDHQIELEQRAEELGLRQRVRFLGPVPFEDMPGYYRGAVALAFPSLIETFGHPLLEAMAAGTPLVLSDIPTFREVAGRAALYFPPSDPVAAAKAVDRLLDDPEGAEARVAMGRARAAELSWKKTVDRLCAVLHEVARSG